MRNRIFTIFMAFEAIVLLAGCNGKSSKQETAGNDSVVVSVADTALYGVIGENTTMHVLEVVTEDGKKVSLEMNTDDESNILGGIFSGDKITLTVKPGSEEQKLVDRAVNLTSLLGKWTSLDRNFQIMENGVVESTGVAESHPYTQWSMVNARLVLNADTFDVVSLDADSMSLENDKGIFVYKRQK